MKHTPGPWFVDKDKIYSSKQRTEYESSTAIALTWDYTEESLANAQLMAAAPEMLRVLELVLGGIEQDDGQGQSHDSFVKNYYHDVLNVINKAKGDL